MAFSRTVTRIVSVGPTSSAVPPLRGSPPVSGLPRAYARGYLLNAPIGAVRGRSRIFDDLTDGTFRKLFISADRAIMEIGA